MLCCSCQHHCRCHCQHHCRCHCRCIPHKSLPRRRPPRQLAWQSPGSRPLKGRQGAPHPAAPAAAALSPAAALVVAWIGAAAHAACAWWLNLPLEPQQPQQVLFLLPSPLLLRLHLLLVLLGRHEGRRCRLPRLLPHHAAPAAPRPPGQAASARGRRSAGRGGGGIKRWHRAVKSEESVQE